MARAEAKKTYYVVQSFSREKGGLRMDAPVQAQSEEGARRTAERLSERKESVIAIARSGNPTTGDFDEPVILASYGEIAELGQDGLPF